MDITIREADVNDAPQTLDYMRLLLEEPGIDIPLEPKEFSPTLDEEQQFLADQAAADNSIFLLAEQEGLIVGQFGLRGDTRQALRHTAKLGISVRNGFRGQGIGDALMRSGMQWALQGEVLKRIELYVYVRNRPAIQLYRKHGFEVECRRRHAVYQGGEYLDDLLMARLL